MANIFGITITYGSVFGIIIWLLEHPEIYDRIKAWIIKPIMGRRGHLQKIFIASDIQSKINSFSKEISKDIGQKIRHKVKIEWVKKSNVETFFQQNELIIRMDCAENLHKNLARATLAYISRTLIPISRPYIDSNLNESINLMIAKKVFDEKGQRQEKEYYNNVFLFPKIEADGVLKDSCRALELLNNKGYFTRLFIRELSYLGVLLHPSPPTIEVKDEVKNFLRYLVAIANTPIVSEPGRLLESREFKFDRKYLKIWVVLLAFVGNVTTQNIRPYLKRIKQALKEGMDIIYVLSMHRSYGLLKLLDKDIQRRLVKQRILKKTSDRSFQISKTPRKKDIHHCIIYRRLERYGDINISEIFEDIPDTTEPDISPDK